MSSFGSCPLIKIKTEYFLDVRAACCPIQRSTPSSAQTDRRAEAIGHNVMYLMYL